MFLDTTRRSDQVDVSACFFTWPTGTFVVRAIFAFNEITASLAIGVDLVSVVFLDMWITDCDHLSSIVGDLILELFWMGEFRLVPGEVSFAIGVFDIEPNDIHRDLMLFKPLQNTKRSIRTNHMWMYHFQKYATLGHRPHRCSSNGIDGKRWTKAKIIGQISRDQLILWWRTGGRGVEPVIAVYCLKMSLGVGPRKKKPSKMPDSNIQWVVTSGRSALSVEDLLENKLATFEKKF